MSARYEMVEVKDARGREIVKMMNVGDLRISTLAKDPEELAETIFNVRNLPIRDDDIMYCSAPKSGSHWIFEIISMLLKGRTETIPHAKETLLVEAIPQQQLEEKPSPRVLNSHLPFHMLPEQLKVDYGDWFSYVLEMEEEIKKGGHDIHLIYYEDLKENGKTEIRKLANFLQVPVTDVLCEAINDKCHIQNMVKDKEYSPEDVEKYFREGFRLYRKGEIGDWKNYFTVAMSEDFDKVYTERMKTSSLTFRFVR